jgi:dihydroorotase
MIFLRMQDVTTVSKTSSGVNHTLSSQLYRRAFLHIRRDLQYGDLVPNAYWKPCLLHHNDGQQIVWKCGRGHVYGSDSLQMKMHSWKKQNKRACWIQGMFSTVQNLFCFPIWYWEQEYENLWLSWLINDTVSIETVWHWLNYIYLIIHC